LRFLSFRSRLAILALVLVVLGAATAGVFLWARYHLRAAEQALDRYQFDEAQHHLDLYLLVNRRSTAVRLLAARTARRRDDYDEAERRLAACLRPEEITPEAALERLLLTAQQGELAEVEGLLQPRTGPDDAEAALVLEALAKGYLNCAWDADALTCLNRLLERQPAHAPALLMRARVLESQALKGEVERETDALHDYEKAAELSPSFEARRGLAGALYRLGRPWEALSEYESLQREQSASPDVLLGLARCRYSLHDVDEARRWLDTLLEQHPDHAAALLERGRLALHAGELSEAEKWLGRAADLAPPCDCEALRLLCRCFDAEHKDEEARRCSGRLRDREAAVVRVDRRILQANRNPQDVALRYEIALELMRLGRERDGLAALFLVLEQQPRHGPAHAALADYLERTGQPARAARHRRAGSPSAVSLGGPIKP
jgi:tetratricopeptide (TPR) repeat protein